MIKGKNLILEGPDNCGKTTLLKQTYNENFNVYNFIQDRGLMTSYIYALHHNRKSFDVLFYSLERELRSNRCIYFILDTPRNVLIDRFNAIGDDRNNLNDILHINELYQTDFFMYGNVFHLHNHENFIDELREKINSINNISNSIIFTDAILAAQTAYLHREYDDLTNYNFQWSFSFKELSSELLDYQRTVYSICHDKDDPRREMYLKFFDDYYKIDDKEQFERDKIRSDLFFNSHIQISKYDEGIDSRRLVACNDSRFSFVQMNVRNHDLYCTFNLRSTNAKNSLFVDMNFVIDLILDFISFLKTYEYKDLGDVDIKQVSIALNISSLYYNE